METSSFLTSWAGASSVSFAAISYTGTTIASFTYWVSSETAPYSGSLTALSSGTNSYSGTTTGVAIAGI